MRHDGGMGAKRAWPERYRVTIVSVLGQARIRHVVTWLGPEKAIAMAVHADGRGYGTADGIYDVRAEDLGAADRDESGLVEVGDDLHDRMEF